MKKLLTALLIAAAITTASVPAVLADDLPDAFWNLNDAYNAALQSGDNNGVIYYGLQIADLIAPMPVTEQTSEIMGSRLDQAGLAYERLGQYANAAQVYQRYIPYAEAAGWPDGVKIAKAKVLQYTPSIDIYTETNEPQWIYGAKNEPAQGVLYGKTVENTIENSLDGDSIVLVYLNFGDSDLRWVENTLKEARRVGATVEIAWNFANEAADVTSVYNHSDAVSQMAELLNKYSDVKVLLRIGAEMNIWGNMASPEDFKNAFQYISSGVKGAASNVAAVWSVGHASAWDVNMEDYYPGDEYVDWVGISAYMMPYFQGRNDWSDFDKFNEVVFSAGNSAEPVKLVDEVVSKFGGRKPIMLAECGASHYVRPLGEDTSYFADVMMRRMYSYLPMVYPQIKAIVYFDVEVTSEINDYALFTSSGMTNTYNNCTKSSRALVHSPNTYPETMFSLQGDTIYAEKSILPIYTYVHTFGAWEPKVDYYLDDAWIGSSSSVPYHLNLDCSKYSDGAHTLTVSAEANGQPLYRRAYTLIINSPISININGVHASADVNPTVQDNRTLVPIRVISEELKANVSWDGASQQVIIKKDGKTVVLTIGSKTATVDGNAITLDVPAKILGNRTFVPIRAVADMLGAKVDWDGNTRTVLINQ
jgi:hypothetical protein